MVPADVFCREAIARIKRVAERCHRGRIWRDRPPEQPHLPQLDGAMLHHQRVEGMDLTVVTDFLKLQRSDNRRYLRHSAHYLPVATRRRKLKEGSKHMKFLMASVPAMGHLNPILTIAHIFKADGHQVLVTTASFLREKVEAVGVAFVPLPPGADLDSRDMPALVPELATLPPEPEQLHALMRTAIIAPMPQQYHALRELVSKFEPDAIITDAFFTGTLPMLLDKDLKRPPIVHCGVDYLPIERDDGAPQGLGLPPAKSEEELERYRNLRHLFEERCWTPLSTYLNELLTEMGSRASPVPYQDVIASLPELYLQPTVPGFEYPRRSLPAAVCFIGALPVLPLRGEGTEWSEDLDSGRKTVLVTQGTIANFDLGQLVAPTLAALAEEDDLLVLVTTGGQPISAIGGKIPKNARVSEFIPFDRVLHRIDVLVTNGGYGTVTMALAAGVPMVVAGLTEDKAEISTRVAWSGSGINLATNTPAPESIRKAVRAVLDNPDYRHQAQRLAAEFATYDTKSEVLHLVKDLVSSWRTDAIEAAT
jgi:MGT family glycosyltransferase